LSGGLAAILSPLMPRVTASSIISDSVKKLPDGTYR